VALNAPVGPVGGVVMTPNVTVPLKPLRLETVIEEVPEEPCTIVSEVAFVLIAKSGGRGWIDTKIVVECESPPLVPVIVIV